MDDNVLSEANSRQAILLTADKDFGELVFRMRRVHAGVILVRLAGLDPTMKSEAVRNVLSQHGPKLIEGFTVISPGLVRIRRGV